MDFDLTENQRRWYDEAERFARQELVDDRSLLQRDEDRTFWREGWQRCAQFGIHGLPIPEQYGGRDLGLSTTIAAMEGLGYGCPETALIFSINASMWTNSVPILRYGTAEQKRQWLPGLCDGSLVGANGASEPEAGSDIFAMKTTAERKGDQWVLNGRKTWITSGPVADLFVCFARTAPGSGPLGISAFIIPDGTPGFHKTRELPKMGVRTVPMGEVAFEDCHLPLDAMLGRQGWGAEVFNCTMEWERGAILASSLGTMRRQIETCIKYARERKQYGQPIGKNQAVAHRIVDMKVRLETCRPMVYKIGWLKDRGEDATVASAVAKLHVSEALVQNSLDAVRTFGAKGFVTEYGIERDLRDSIGSLIYSGTNDIQRNLIAASLKL